LMERSMVGLVGQTPLTSQTRSWPSRLF